MSQHALRSIGSVKGGLPFISTIFLGAFLLFQVQPIVGRFILPWFGGSPAVWMTCMLFFQVMLWLGYGYAHGIVRRLPLKGQVGLHVGLLVLSLAAMPITPAEAWKPEPGDEPILRILSLLAASVGIPFLLLASTGPLLQSWFSRLHPSHSAYPLYAVSNTASLLALLTYPIAFEPSLRLQSQTLFWSIGNGLFVLLCCHCGWRVWQSSARGLLSEPAEAIDAASQPAAATSESQPVDGLTIVLWLALSTAGCVMLLATTDRLTQNVASVPFLWILPLAIYLFTFILCFDGEGWYKRDLYRWIFLVSLGSAWAILLLGSTASLMLQLAVYSLTLYASCMVCHGELVRLRPPPQHLTLFYLMLSCGGALGGVLVSLVAPMTFDTFVEYPLGLILCTVLVLFINRVDSLRSFIHKMRSSKPRAAVTLSVIAVVAVFTPDVARVGWQRYLDNNGILAATRDFYGALYVGQFEPEDPQRHQLTLVHGNIFHGSQFQHPDRKRAATFYYDLNSGAALAIQWMREQRNAPLRVGAVGLGVGTVATYAEQRDRVRFYEISSDVIDLAESYFTFMSDARDRGAEVDIALGDARIVMESELESGGGQGFDVLIIDAFSGDAVPIHLLTRECFAMYRQHLANDGVLAVHVSNRYLNLGRVVRGLAEEAGYESYWIESEEDVDRGVKESNWVLITKNPGIVVGRSQTEDSEAAGAPLVWTDDFSSLFSILK